MQTSTTLYTLDSFDKFLAEHGEDNYELIYGEIIRKMPTEAHGKLAALIAHFLLAFILPRGIQAHVGVEVRHQAPNDAYNSRLPDVSLRLTDSPPINDGAVPQMPDLAVEIQSPTDDPHQMRQKAHYYLQQGTHIVWLIYPTPKTAEICTLDNTNQLAITTLDVDGTLTCQDVLPDFHLQVSDLFRHL